MTDFVDGVALTAQELNDAFAGKVDAPLPEPEPPEIPSDVPRIIASGQAQTAIGLVIPPGGMATTTWVSANGAMPTDVATFSFAEEPTIMLLVLTVVLQNWAGFKFCNLTTEEITLNPAVVFNWQILR